MHSSRAARQPLAHAKQTRGAGLLHQARGQRHRVGGLAEERRPHAHVLGRHLVGQQAEPAAAQRADHLRTPASVAGAVARPGRSREPCRPARRSQGLRAGRYSTVIGPWAAGEALGVGLRRDLEAAHVRRQRRRCPAPPCAASTSSPPSQRTARQELSPAAASTGRAARPAGGRPRRSPGGACAGVKPGLRGVAAKRRR